MFTCEVETHYGRINSPILLKVVLPYVNNEKCKQLLRDSNIQVGSGQVCAGGSDQRDTCVGDSGGPLMHYDQKTVSWVLTGIVSLGPRGCGTPGVPGIYTRVDEYIGWIEQKIY